MNCRVPFDKTAAREAYRAAEMAVTLLHPKLTKKSAESLICLDLDNTVKVTLDALNDKQVRPLYAEFADPVEGGALSLKVYAL